MGSSPASPVGRNPKCCKGLQARVDLPKLFQRFSECCRDARGTSLGLHPCRLISAALQGSINASHGPGASTPSSVRPLSGLMAVKGRTLLPSQKPISNSTTIASTA